MAINIQLLLYILPILIPLFMYFIFKILTKLVGLKLGYFLAFLTYWILCLTIPTIILNINEITLLLRPIFPNAWELLLLLIPPLLAIFLGPFRTRIKQANACILIVSLLLAVINGFLEEYLWRGFYILNCGNNIFLGIVLPTIGFMIWHFAPQSVLRSDNPVIFMASVAFIGILWAIVSYYQMGILGAVISHIICDFSGIGGLWYFTHDSPRK